MNLFWKSIVVAVVFGIAYLFAVPLAVARLTWEMSGEISLELSHLLDDVHDRLRKKVKDIEDEKKKNGKL